jgi:hypothetical protein
MLISGLNTSIKVWQSIHMIITLHEKIVVQIPIVLMVWDKQKSLLY